MKKRILSILTALALCLSLLPVTALAAGGGTITSSSTEAEIIAAFNGNATVNEGTITLTDDVTVSDTVIFESGNWKLDLGTYTLTGANKKAAILITGGSLTVTGSGSVKGGIGAVAIQATGGSLTIQGSVSITGGTGDYGSSGGWNGIRPGAGGSGGAAIDSADCDITIDGGVTIRGGDGGHGGDDIATYGTTNGGTGGSGAAAIQAKGGSLTIRNSVSITGGTGGTGGNGAPGGYQGSGGAGGSGGVAIAGTGCGITISDNGTICGGNGGNGGKGGNHVYETNGGNGGIGGGGIQVDGGSLTIRNSVSITGGAGGSGGTGGSSRGKGGAGGSGGNVIGAQDTSLEVSDSVSRTGGNGGAGGSGGSSGSSGGSGSSGSSDTTGNYFLVENGNWTVIGNVTVSEDKEVSGDLIVNAGAKVTINSGATLTVNGSVINNGTIIGSGTLSPKQNQTAPTSAPTIKSVTANSVTLNAAAPGLTAAEYAYTTGEEIADSIPADRWQTSTEFSGLASATNYTFYVRYKGTGIYNPSGLSSGTPQYTCYATPVDREGYSINYAAETITVQSGYEVNTDSGFGSSTNVASGTVNPGQTLYIRRAASGDISASAGRQFTIPSRPDAPKVTVNYVTETLATTTAMEYKMGDGEWTDCTDNMAASTFGWDGSAEVTVQFRMKAAENDFASGTASVTILQRDPNTMILELTDIYDDGWNDAVLKVYRDQDEQPWKEITLADGYDFGTVFLSYLDAATYSFRWQKGDWDGEIGLTVWMPGDTEPVFKAEAGYFSAVENDTLLFSLEILKITAQPADAEITYGESATLTVAAENYFKTDDLTYQWYQVGESDTATAVEGATGSTLSRSGLTVGTYTYYCAVSYGNITVKSSTATVTVTSATGSVSITGDPGKTYDGQPVSMAGKYTVTGDGTVTVEYKVKDAANETYTATAPTNAGSYTVRVSVTDGSNYTAASATKDFTIAPATIDSVTLTAATAAYTGSAHTPTVSQVKAGSLTLNASDYTVSYKNSAGTVVTELKNAGTYQVVVTAVENSNFTGSKTADFQITVAVNAWTTEPAITGWTYGDTPSTPTGAAQFGTVTVEYRPASGTDADYRETVPTDAGNYKVRFSVAATDNYGGLSEELDFTISRKAVTVSGITAENKTYDRTTAATLNYDSAVISGVVSGDALSVTATGTFSDANAGTNKTVDITGLTLGGASKDNYVLAASGQQTTATANILKKNVTAVVTVAPKTYDGKRTATVTATVNSSDLISGDSVTISGLTGTFDTANAETGKTVTIDASSVSVTGTGAGNYNVIIPDTAQGTISMANQTAPSAPQIASRTDTSVTLQAIPDNANGAKAQYSIDGGTWQDSPVFSGLTSATQYSFTARYVATANHNASAASAATTAYTAYAAPSAGINYESETLTGLEPNASYTIQSSAATADSNGKIAIAGDWMGTTVSIVRNGTSEIPASAAQSLDIPARPAAPTGGEGYTINYNVETLTVTSGYEVNTAADFTGDAFTGGSVTPGSTLYIRKAATASAFKSEVQTIQVPARPATPTLIGVNETVDGKHDGQITGVSTQMEYRQGEAGNWTVCTGTVVADLAPGTYQARVKATSSSFASLAADVTIDTGAARTYTLNVTAPTFDAVAYGYVRPAAKAITISSSGNWQSTISNVTVDSAAFTIGGSGSAVAAGGSINTWTVQPAADLAAGLYAATITATYDGGATATTTVSFTVTTAEQDAPAAPELESRTSTSVTLKTIPDNANGVKAQYSIDGGANWQDSSVFSGLMPATQYSFTARYIATDNHNASAASDASTAYTAYATPGAGIDYESETLTGLVPSAEYTIQGSTVTADDDGKVAIAGGWMGTTVSIVRNGTSEIPDSAAQSLAVPARPGAPVTGEGYTINYSAETLTVTSGYEVNTAADFSGTAFTSGTVTPGSTFFIRKAAAAGSSFKSEVQTLQVPARPDAPAAPVVQRRTYHSVTLETVPDNENGAKAQYSIDGGETWQDSPKFTELKPVTKYSFTVRYSATENSFVSPISGATEITTTTIPSDSYSPIVEDTDHGTVTISPQAPTQGIKVTVTPTPEDGYEVDKVVITGKDGKPVQVTDNGDGTYSFTQPAGAVTVRVSFKSKTQLTFADVPTDAYYYDAVYWAVANGITNGTGDGTTFSPDATCTRDQAVTFLWRAAGCPAPKSSENPFTDVNPDAYYYEAMLWAVEQGITTGTGDGTTFSPDATCTRDQAVTFLWRTAGQPAAADGTSFADVSADAYYAFAVRWAVEQGITNGTSDGMTFSPADDCTRAQIVTFLYRCLNK